MERGGEELDVAQWFIVHLCRFLFLMVHSIVGAAVFQGRKELFYLTTHATHFKDHSARDETYCCLFMDYSFLLSSKGSFIYTISKTVLHIPRRMLYQLWTNGLNEKRKKLIGIHHEGSIRPPIAP